MSGSPEMTQPKRRPALLAARSASSFALTCALLAVAACGSGDGTTIVKTPASAADEWPAPATAPPDASSVEATLRSADGAQVRVRAYLVAVTLPCPDCTSSLGRQKAEVKGEGIGRARAAQVVGPGCEPCPAPAATLSDEPPKAAAAQGMPLRAIGAALGLQPRHVGHLFLLTGTFHANGPTGAELDVSDVRALP